jgi:hypothetical protein
MAKRRGVFCLACAVVLVAGAVIGVGGAGAAKKVKTQVKSLTGGPNGAQVQISSPEPACKKKRRVDLYRAAGTSLQAPGPNDVKVAGGRTNAKGFVDLEVQLFAGFYYVVVKALNDLRDFDCKAVTSTRMQF